MSCCKGESEAVGGVGGEQRMLDADDFGERLGGDFGGEGFGLRADDDGGDGQARFARPGFWPAATASQLMRLMRPSRSSRTTQNAAHRTRTSNFSFSTRAAAASLGVPGRICVDFCFCGRVMLLEHDDGSGVHGEFGGGDACALPWSWRA